jgi:hypothetical protein
MPPRNELLVVTERTAFGYDELSLEFAGQDGCKSHRKLTIKRIEILSGSCQGIE